MIPIAGGRGTNYQVIRMLVYRLSPLCLAATTDCLTELCRDIIDYLKSLGVDYLESVQ